MANGILGHDTAAPYKQPVSDTLRVHEIYLSLQGESTFAGLPCVFVRLTGCDLRCSYCDTAYAFTGGEAISIEAILNQVDALAEGYPEPPLVELTGGEPLLQKATPALLAALCDRGFTVLLETSGAHDISRGRASPSDRRLKCPSSGESDRNLPANLHHLRASDEVKCVIGTREDYDWAKTQPASSSANARYYSMGQPIGGRSAKRRAQVCSRRSYSLPAANWPRPSLPIAFPSGSNSNNTNTFGRPIKRAFDEPAPQLLSTYESRNVTHLAEDGAWPIVWERAKGVHVWDTDGNKYLDLTGAFAVAATGHANPRVTKPPKRSSPNCARDGRCTSASA